MPELTQDQVNNIAGEYAAKIEVETEYSKIKALLIEVIEFALTLQKT